MGTWLVSPRVRRPATDSPPRHNRSRRISIDKRGRYTRPVSKRLVDIDDDLLEEATAILGASTMKEAVNRSLESVVLAARRRRHADRLQDMRGLDLDDPQVMSGAWG
jgi:Arc/MetJ family transcription regulator